MSEISDLDSTCLEKEDSEQINVRFVIPSRCSNQSQCSDDMKLAFQSCEEHELSPIWITEAECYPLTPSKQDVFVLQEFDSNVFTQLRNFKCIRLVGPRCVLTCLITGVAIPYNCSPIFTTAMRDTVVTTTNIYGKEKEELIKKMGYMGAVCSAKLTESNTHLVAKNVLSLKYEKAVERNIPVMTEKWVEALWEASCKRNVHANDPEFLVYKCPVFHGLTVTCSNFGRSEKEELKNLITVNGGVYSGELQLDITKMLVINYPVGTKYTYACEWHMPCVTAAWVHESVKKGYALAIEPYKTPERGAKCSTPVNDQSRIGPSDFSMVSSIAPDEIPQATHVNETVADMTLQSIGNKAPAPSIHKLSKGKGRSSYAEVLQKLDVKDAKKAGPFLDGCNVYLSGFADDELEKLRAILNYGGATRFNEITEAVTHVIVGENVTADMKIIKSNQFGACAVNISWLVESLKQKCPVNEEQFSCWDIPKQSTEPASPLSKKGIQLLRRGSERIVVPFPPLPEAKNTTANEIDQHATTEIVNQYLQSVRGDGAFEEQNRSIFKRPSEVTVGGPATSRESQVQEDVQKQKTADSESSLSQSSESREETAVAVFASLTFLVLGLEEEQKAQVCEVLESRGGKVASNTFKGIADYAILDITPPAVVMTNEAASEIVNFLWVEDCIWSSELVPIQYYHRPLVFDYTKKPLEKCVVCISSYTGVERKFISMVAAQLGAICQDMFARKDFPKKNTLASTHLICCDPGSAKYSAAIKWNIPAVSHKWVMACAREGRRADEKCYVTGAESDSSEEQSQSSSTSESVHSVNNHKTLAAPDIDHDANCNSETKAKHKRIEQLRQEGNMGPPVSPAADNEPHKSPLTPLNRNSGGFSQETPIHIPKLQDDSLLGRWPFAPNAETPKGPSYVQTPETPYGQVLKDNPSPDMRKRWKKWIDDFPEFEKSPPVRKRKLSTPLSELKRRCWEKILPKKTTGENEAKEPEALAKKHINETSSSEGLPAATSRLPSMSDLHVVSTAGSSANTTGKPLALANTAKRLFNSPDVTPSSSPSAVHRSLEKLNQVLTTPNTESPAVRIRRTRNEIVGEEDDFQRHKVPAKDSQFEVVGWEDPSERNYSRGPHIFMLSSIESEERERYEQIIINLGGQVADKQTFDISITHLACGRPTRSEKLLASIASGKWVLHKSYLDHCAEKGSFILEEEFEWGNPSAISIGRQLKCGTLEYTLAQAAYRWRCRLSRSDRGAFTGMVAVVCVSRERQEAFKRLICAGGGKIVEPQFLDQATHFFLEFNKVKPSVSIEELVKRRIPCVAPMYLNDYLIKDPPPQAHDMVIPEYKSILEKLNKEESNN